MALTLDKIKNCNTKVFLVYPYGAGGKFVAACLGLSDSCVLQKSSLANQQLLGTLNYTDKLHYLYNRLDNAQQTGQWNDFDLGCIEMNGIEIEYWNTWYPERIVESMSPVIEKCIDSKLYFFEMCNKLPQIYSALALWEHAKVIVFTNYRQHVDQRRGSPRSNHQVQEYYNRVKGPDWPIQAPTTQTEFDQLPTYIKKELTEDFSNEIVNYFDHTHHLDQLWAIYAQKLKQELGSRVFEFSVADAFSDDYYSHYTDICSWLGVEPANEDDVKVLYSQYRQVADAVGFIPHDERG